MRGAVSPGLFELLGEATVGQIDQALLGDGRPGEVTAVFQAVAVVGAHADVRMHVEAGHLRMSIASTVGRLRDG